MCREGVSWERRISHQGLRQTTFSVLTGLGVSSLGWPRLAARGVPHAAVDVWQWMVPDGPDGLTHALGSRDCSLGLSRFCTGASLHGVWGQQDRGETYSPFFSTSNRQEGV